MVMVTHVVQPSGTPVWINGRKVPIVGRVSMDMISVDLGSELIDRVGDEAILWGDVLPVEEIAKYSGISAYELITKLTSRVIMEYPRRTIAHKILYLSGTQK